MKASDDLFELVHALNRSEKAYFQLHTSFTGGDNKKYQALFRAIEKQKVYNEAVLKKKFGVKNFSYTKYYLYSTMLDVLHSYHAEQTKSMQLNLLANQVDVLFRKGLHRQCKKLINRLRKQAYEREAFLVLLQVIPWERKLMSIQGFANQTTKSLQGLDEEETLLIKKYEQLVQLSFYANHLVFLQKTVGTPTDGKVQQYYNDTIEKLTAAKEKDMLSVKALIQYHHNLATAYFGKRDFARSLGHIRTNIDILLKHSSIFSNEEDRLVAHFNNLLTLAVDLEQWNLFDEYLAKMKAFDAQLSKIENKQLSLRITERALAFGLRSAVQRNRIKEGLQLQGDIEQLLITSIKETGPSYLIQWFYHLGVLHFLSGNLKEAAKWLQHLQYNTEPDVRRDIHAFGRVIELLIYFNEGSYLLIEPQVRSIRRQFNNLEQLGAIEKSVFHYLPKLTKAKPAEQKQLFTVLQSETDTNTAGSSMVIRIAVGHWIKDRLKKVK